MKILLITFFTITLVLLLAACGGNGSPSANAPDSDDLANPPVMTPETMLEVTPNTAEDPCPCCPDCIQEECVCED